MGEVLNPRKQAVVDRLRRRIENYRRRQTEFMPRFDQTFNGLCEQNIQETLLLKHKFLENKAKRTAKKQDKKQSEIPNNIQNNLLAQQKFLKRSAEDLDGPGEYGDSGPKIQCGAGGGGGGGASGGGGSAAGGGTPGNAPRATESLTKFSVEIVQQLEFTTSAANSQPQQISTNVTVKALTNASVKSDMGGTNSPKSAPDTPNNQNPSNQSQRTSSSNCVDLGNLVECKQEPDSEFVDLEQCAAALEKDAQNNGASFPGFSEFIGDEGGDEIITSDAFKDLISEISDFHPEFMKDFDFDEHKPNISALANTLSDNNQNGGSHNVVTSITATNQMKVESDSKEGIQIHQQHMIDVGKSPPNNVQYSSGQYDPNMLGKSRMAPYSSLEFGKAELSPAAQTLKQMAEQHQNKTQIGMNFPGNRNPRSPYGDYQFSSNSDYINSPSSTNTPPSSGQFINKNIPPSSQNYTNQNQSTNTGNGQSLPDVKQEVMFSATQTQNFQTGSNIEMQKRMQAMQQQQMSNQAQSPQGPKTPNNPSMMGNYKQQYSPYGSPGGHGSPGYMPRGQGTGGPFVGPGSTPSSRPPSVPSGSQTTLQMSQAQQMQVSQQTAGQQIQVSAGQHMQMTGDIKPNVSVAAQQQQGMFFNQQSDTYTVSQSQTINFTQQSLRGRGVGPMPRPEQQHKLLQQQQQMIRAQQQQMSIRPPPPEYKPSQPQIIHSISQQRFPSASMRRPGPGQQPMPPSGPMMRPQHTTGGTVFMNNPGMTRNMAPGGYMPRQRPPNVSVGPDGMPISSRSGAEWRHILMSQQQNMGFSHVRPFSTHQGNFAAVQNNSGGMQMHPQIRNQLPPGAGGQMQVMPQDQMMMQGQPNNSNQMSMNLQMSQSQTMSLSSGIVNPHHHMHHMTSSGNSHIHQFSNSAGFTNTSNSFVNSPGGPTSSSTQTGIGNNPNTNNINNNMGNNNNNSNNNNNNPTNSISNSINNNINNNISNNSNNNNNSNSSSNNNNNNSGNNPSANDFGFEFLDSLPGDPPFSAQDLLSSLESASNFNINDIL